MLRLVQGVLWGERPVGRPWPDLTWLEGITLGLLAVMTLWLGFHPATFLEPLHQPVDLLMQITHSLAQGGGLP